MMYFFLIIAGLLFTFLLILPYKTILGELFKIGLSVLVMMALMYLASMPTHVEWETISNGVVRGVYSYISPVWTLRTCAILWLGNIALSGWTIYRMTKEGATASNV